MGEIGPHPRQRGTESPERLRHPIMAASVTSSLGRGFPGAGSGGWLSGGLHPGVDRTMVFYSVLEVSAEVAP